MWDVHVRETATEDAKVVRVEGSYYIQDGGYLVFQNPTEDPKDFRDFTPTALFPHQQVARVIRVEEALTEEGLSAQSADLLAKDGTACVSSKCGCR
jgi:hypothetical protein